MIEPGVHRCILRHAQPGGVDTRTDRHRRLDRQGCDRVEDILKHPSLTGESTCAQTDQDSRYGRRRRGARHALPHHAGMAPAARRAPGRDPHGRRRFATSPRFRHQADRYRAAEETSRADRGHVLDPSIEAVHEDDRRDTRRHDLGDPADQNHVNDDGIDVGDAARLPRRTGRGAGPLRLERNPPLTQAVTAGWLGLYAAHR